MFSIIDTSGRVCKQMLHALQLQNSHYLYKLSHVEDFYIFLKEKSNFHILYRIS